MSELKACPFCGGGLSVNMDKDGWWHHSCVDYCYLSAGFPTREEAIAAANARAERTCHNVMPMMSSGMPYPDSFICSACGAHEDGVVKEDGMYCYNCGAKVVVE